MLHTVLWSILSIINIFNSILCLVMCSTIIVNFSNELLVSASFAIIIITIIIIIFPVTTIIISFTIGIGKKRVDRIKAIYLVASSTHGDMRMATISCW